MDSSPKGMVNSFGTFILHSFDRIFSLLCIWLVVIERKPEIYSGESASEGSSEGSDTNSQNVSTLASRTRFFWCVDESIEPHVMDGFKSHARGTKRYMHMHNITIYNG